MSAVFLLCIVICNIAYAEEAYVYDAHGRRDPLIPLLKPAPPPPPPLPEAAKVKRVVETLADIEFIEDVKLQGIAIDSGGRRAVIINNEIIGEGEVAHHLTIKRVSANEITLLIDEKEYKLSIYGMEEGG